MKNNILQFKILGVLIIVFVIIIFFLQNFYIHPRYMENVKNFIHEKQYGYIVYKNNHRCFSLYISKHWNKNEVKKLSCIKESEAFKKPKKSYIDYVNVVNDKLYKNSTIGDKIEKLPNSNKCYLYKKDSIFRYNCWVIPKEIRLEIGNIEEWKSDEIGFWKVR